jgi:hypothetical protein
LGRWVIGSLGRWVILAESREILSFLTYFHPPLLLFSRCLLSLAPLRKKNAFHLVLNNNHDSTATAPDTMTTKSQIGIGAADCGFGAREVSVPARKVADGRSGGRTSASTAGFRGRDRVGSNGIPRRRRASRVKWSARSLAITGRSRGEIITNPSMMTMAQAAGLPAMAMDIISRPI